MISINQIGISLPGIIVLVLTVILTGLFQDSHAQCASTVPTFNVDLTGAPDSTWISPPTVRIDTCCGAVNPDNCVLFIVTLDSTANGIVMDIPTGGSCGARPTGSLFYQVNCGPPVAIGTPVCLSGPGPHNITFCKPGNNANCYQITSFPEPSTSGNTVSQDGCSAQLSAYGYDEMSLQWSSVPSNPLFESYLDCLVGCDTVTATYQTGAPAFVDYQVCGSPIGGCDTTPYCDTMRVFFVSTIGVVIQPDSPTVCFGAGATNVWAVPGGGAAPYSYQWYDGSGNPIGNSDTIAAGPGTFIVEITDTLACSFVRDTVVVTEFLSPIEALPGNDSIICGFDTIPLLGAIQAASGGIWTTGQGTFIPGPTSPTGQYIPSAGEYAAGSVSLTLLTTGNGTCPPDSDQVVFTLSPRPSPIITGPDPVCEFTGGHNYSTASVAGHSYLWSVSGGIIVSGQGTNTIGVSWSAFGMGTVSVTQTNADGCDTTFILPVTINPKPNPLIIGSPPFCEWSTGNPYSVTSTAGNTYVWTVSGGTINSGQGTPAILVDWGTAGPATVQVMESNVFGCDTTVAIAFAINPNPNPVVIGADSVCAFSTGHIYSSANTAGNTFLWTVTGGTIASGQNTNSISVDWGAAGNGTVQLTQTNTNGCDTTVTFPVVILPNPISSITGPVAVCQFETGAMYSTPGAPGNTYSWSISGGAITSGQGSNAIVVDWGGAGSGNITLVETTTLGCDTTLILNVAINPKPNPVISGNPPFCEFAFGVPYSTPLVAGNTYLWTVIGGSVSVGQGTNTILVNWGPNGSGSVTVTETTPLGCDTTVTVPITIHATPAPVLVGLDTVCEFTSGVAYSTTLNPGSTYAWTISGGSIVSGQNSNSVQVNWSTSGSGTISVTETNAFGCDSTASTTIILLPNPSPVITGLNPVCEFDAGIGYSVSPIPGDSYNWVLAGGTIASGQGTATIQVDWGAAGPGVLTLTQTSNLGCDTTIVFNLTISPRPDPVISGNDSVCAFGTGFVYSSPNIGGDTYSWTIGGGNIVSGQGTNSIVVDWGSSGTGFLDLIQTNPQGCDTTVSFPVEILANPTSAIIGPNPVCAYSASTYTASNLPGNTFVWTVTGGAITNGQGTASLGITWSVPGQGSISLTQTTALGCDTTMILNIQILSAPIPELTGPTEVCQFSTGHVYTTPNVFGVSYNWTAIGGTITGGQGSNSAVITWDDSGSGTVILEAVDQTGCDTTLSLTVNVLPSPEAIISPGDTFGCGFLETPFNAQGGPNVTSYFWNFGNGQTSTLQNNTVIYQNAGTYPVSLIVQNDNGCSDTGYATVFITPGPIASFSYNPPSPVNIETDSLEWINNSLFSNQYSWNFGDGNGDTVFIPTHQYDTLGNLIIQLIALDTFGCADTAYLPIELFIEVDLFVPNAFTPNEDGTNDDFYVVSRNLTDFHIQIYNRWGQLIFESFDSEFRWNGYYQGQPCQEDAYVFKIIATGRGQSRFRRAGTVTLYR